MLPSFGPRAVTKHITGMSMCDLSYSLLTTKKERYGHFYVWKIVEGLGPNPSAPITCSFSDCRGRMYIMLVLVD